MGMFDDCRYCKPPKRTPTCKFDGTCNKYAEAKAKYDKLKAAADRERDIGIAIMSQRGEKVRKAVKNRMKGRKYGE